MNILTPLSGSPPTSCCISSVATDVARRERSSCSPQSLDRSPEGPSGSVPTLFIKGKAEKGLSSGVPLWCVAFKEHKGHLPFWGSPNKAHPYKPLLLRSKAHLRQGPIAAGWNWNARKLGASYVRRFLGEKSANQPL